MARSMIGAILGVLKQGSAYVPLDPAFPEDRLGLLLDDARVTTLLVAPAHVELAERLAKGTRRIVRIDADGPRIPIATGPRPDTTAYILYTSGSSGRPKGISQNHRNVLHYIRGYVNTLEVTSTDRLTLVASYTFDASIVDIFTALISGATLYPSSCAWPACSVSPSCCGTNGSRSITRHRRCIGRSRRIDPDTASSIRAVVLGGEKVHAQDVLAFRERFDGRALFVNLYGASEVTIASMELIAGNGRVPIGGVSIGAPVENTELLLIDADGRPASVRGEIAVASRHLALGYWNAPSSRSEHSLMSRARRPPHLSHRRSRAARARRRARIPRTEGCADQDSRDARRARRDRDGARQHPRVAQCAVTVDRSGKGDPVLLAFVVIAPPGSATELSSRAASHA